MEAVTIEQRRSLTDTRAAYLLPKDLGEGNRLDFQHYLLRQVMHGNYLAPVSPSINIILDIGCGTGLWCREMARAFPSVQIIGLDLEESQAVKERPATYYFVQSTILRPPWPSGDSCIDFTHMRGMLLSIPALAWPRRLQEIVRVTRPGGWIELVECGCSIVPAGPVTQKVCDWIRESAQISGIDPDLPHRLSRMAAQAGLRQVQEHHFDLPLGEWAGHLGRAALVNAQAFYEAMEPHFTRQLGMDFALVRSTWQWLVREWNQAQARVRWYVVVGQREGKGGDAARVAPGLWPRLCVRGQGMVYSKTTSSF